MRQIARAREAAARLRSSRRSRMKPYALGYADQSHLTRDVKRLRATRPRVRRREPVWGAAARRSARVVPVQDSAGASASLDASRQRGGSGRRAVAASRGPRLDIRPYTIAIPDEELADLRERLAHALALRAHRRLGARHARALRAAPRPPLARGLRLAGRGGAAQPPLAVPRRGRRLAIPGCVRPPTTAPCRCSSCTATPRASSSSRASHRCSPILGRAAQRCRDRPSRRRAVDAGVRVLHPAPARLGHPLQRGVRRPRGKTRLRPVRRVRRGCRRRRQRAALPRRGRPRARLDRGDRPRRDRDYAAPHSRRARAPCAPEGRPREDFSHLALQTTRPLNAYGLTDSPIAQATWIVEKVQEWTDPRGPPRGRRRPRRAAHPRDGDLVRSRRRRRGQLLYEAAHAQVAWGRQHDRPQGMASVRRGAAHGAHPQPRRAPRLPGESPAPRPLPPMRRPAGSSMTSAPTSRGSLAV